MKRTLIAVAVVVTVSLAVVAVIGCGCQAHPNGAKNPESDLGTVVDQANVGAKELKAETEDLSKQLDVASSAVDESCQDLEDFLVALPDPKPSAVAPVVAADKRLKETAAPAVEAAKVDTKKIADVTAQMAALTQSLGKIRKDVKALATDRDNGWKEAATEKQRADDGMRRDFLIVGVIGVLALGLGIYLLATGNFKVGLLSLGGGVAVIIGAAVGVWLLDHWWQVAIGLVVVGGLATLAALAWQGKLGAKAQTAVKDAITAGENAHLVNQNWIANLEAKVQSLEQKLTGGEPPTASPTDAPATTPAAAPLAPTPL
jgi:hypothetical protein